MKSMVRIMREIRHPKAVGWPTIKFQVLSRVINYLFSKWFFPLIYYQHDNIHLIIVGARACQEHNTRCTNTHKESETKIYEVQEDAYVLGAGKRDLLMIYIRLQENYKVLSRTPTRKSITLKMGSRPLFIEETPKSAPDQVQKQF